MCATTVSGRCGRISATVSPRPTPSAASALDSRFACCCRSQNVYAAVAPDSSSQYSAKRARSSAQRPQQASRDVELRGHVPAVRGVDLGVAVDGASARADRDASSEPRGLRRDSPRVAAAAAVRRASRRRQRRAARPSPRPSRAAARSGGRSGSALIDLRRHAACSACAGWYSTAGTISDCTAARRRACAARGTARGTRGR